MIIRIGFLVLALALFLAFTWGAVSTWATVFSEGPSTPVPVSGRGGGDRGEASAIYGAVFLTVVALLSAIGVALAWLDLAKRRR